MVILVTSLSQGPNISFSYCSDKGYFVDLFVRASNTPAIKMYEKVMIYSTVM